MGNVFDSIGTLDRNGRGRRPPRPGRRPRPRPRHRGRGFSPYPSYYGPYDYGYETSYAVPIEEQLLLMDASGKKVAVVIGRVVQVFPGYTVRRMTVTESALVPAPVSGFGDDGSVF